MSRMLVDGGALLLEMADVGSLRFVSSDPAAELWRDWWFALGRARSAAHDVADRTACMLEDAGFVIERCDRYQPVSTIPDAKMLHALGFEQLVPAYIEHAARAPTTSRHIARF